MNFSAGTRLAANHVDDHAIKEKERAKGGPPPTLLHPRIAETYHVQVSKVIEALQDADHEGDATDTIRGLIEQITVTPEPGSGKRPLPRIDLRGPRCGDSVLEP